MRPNPPDFHPDEFYQVHSSTEAGIACHRKKGPAGTYGAETTDCDSPLSLVNATFDWISKNVKDQIDFVVWTGDTARHDSDEKLPRAGPHVLDMNRQIAKKFVEAFSDNGQLAVPIIPTFGNNDFLPHNIFYPGPNKWLQAYSDIWHRFIPEEQRHAFGFGGWFEVEVIPNKLSVFSLNTMYFFDRNAGVDGCALPSEPGFKHMEWLSVQLQRLRERGMKAILIGHVPPARTDSKQNWDETCWQKYTLWLKQFRDVVTGALYGHMNIDHFLLQDTKDIDLSLVDLTHNRHSIEEDFSVVSKGDYLIELRDSWSDLPGSVIRAVDEDTEEDEDVAYDDDMSDLGKKKKKGKGKKGLKKIGGKYAERYQVSLISPSIVPNYFPTLRIIEYNISGLEDSKVWKDTYSIGSTKPEDASEPWDQDDDTEEDRQELKRDLEAEKKKKKKGKKGKKKKPKDPALVIPADPPKGSLPGPAYLNQPFTFTGYTQYFANLTYINNDMTNAIGGNKWRDGDFSNQDPKHKDPQPRKFGFEVEYSTFTDKIFKLPDLTVRSYLELAYRVGKKQQKKHGKGKGKKGKGKAIEEVDEDFEDDEDLDVFDGSSLEGDAIDALEEEDMEEDPGQPGAESDSDSDSDDEIETDKKGKGKKNKKKHKTNKVWLHFLHHAFVSTIPKKELKKV